MQSSTAGQLRDVVTPSHCGRCLLAPTNVQLVSISFLLFFLHLSVTGQWRAWARSAALSLRADLFWPVATLVGVATAAAGVRHCSLVVMAHGLTLAWDGMLRICVLHELEVAGGWEGVSIDSIAGVLFPWAWQPWGLLAALLGPAWRPWWFLEELLVLSLFGTWAAPGVLWWEWREVLLGGVFWFSALTCFVVARTNFPGLSLRLCLLACLSVGFLVLVPTFLLTTTPLLAFWAFLLRPWLELLGAGLRCQCPRLRSEEMLASAAAAWALARSLYIARSAWLERRLAVERVQEGLRQALEHPFEAHLEEGFGRLRSGRQISQRVSYLGSFVFGLEPLRLLEEKSRRLAEVRRADLRRQVGSAAVLPGTLSLHIRREHLLEDSWQALLERPITELLAPSMKVFFEGEVGVDAGGLARDWFDSVAVALQDGAGGVQGFSLLTMAPDQTLMPRPIGADRGEIKEGEEAKYRALLAVGRFVALAVLRRQPLPLSVSLVACKHLLQEPIGMGDVRRLDVEFYRARVEPVLREGGPAALAAALGEPLTFTSAPTELRPKPEELLPGGASTVVTEDNKTEYVQLLCQAYLCGGLRREISAMLRGFWDLLPLEVLQRCEVSPRELSVLISGIRKLDPEEWQSNSDMDDSTTQVGPWFWQLVREGLDDEQRCLLLHFVTGSSRLPPGGFAALNPRFSITVSAAGSNSHLPHAHTCVNQLVLHKYTSKDVLRQKLLQSLSVRDFGFA